MKIFMLMPKDTSGLWRGRLEMTSMDFFLVRAPNENRAREMASRQALEETPGAWLNSEHSSCQEITAPGEESVIYGEMQEFI